MQTRDEPNLLTRSDWYYLSLFFTPLVIGVAGTVLSLKVSWAGQFVFYGALIQVLVAIVYALIGGKVSFIDRSEVVVIPVVVGMVLLLVQLVMDGNSIINDRRLALISIVISILPSLVVGYFGKRNSRRAIAVWIGLRESYAASSAHD